MKNSISMNQYFSKTTKRSIWNINVKLGLSNLTLQWLWILMIQKEDVLVRGEGPTEKKLDWIKRSTIFWLVMKLSISVILKIFHEKAWYCLSVAIYDANYYWTGCDVFLYHCLQNVNPWIIQDMWSGQFLLIWILINFINWTSKWKRWTWKVLIWSKWYQNQTLSQNNKTFSHLMWV